MFYTPLNVWISECMGVYVYVCVWMRVFNCFFPLIHGYRLYV